MAQSPAEPMAPAEAAARMRAIAAGSRDDTEVAHIEADRLLCDLLIRLGYGEAVQVFKDMDKWYA